jgi:hypothetical protein
MRYLVKQLGNNGPDLIIDDVGFCFRYIFAQGKIDHNVYWSCLIRSCAHDKL